MYGYINLCIFLFAGMLVCVVYIFGVYVLEIYGHEYLFRDTEARSMSNVMPYQSSFYLLEARSLTKPGTRNAASKPCDLSMSSSRTGYKTNFVF